MSDFQDMQELLRDFLTEAGELLAGVDNKLVELERAPDDAKLPQFMTVDYVRVYQQAKK